MVMNEQEHVGNISEKHLEYIHFMYGHDHHHCHNTHWQPITEGFKSQFFATFCAKILEALFEMFIERKVLGCPRPQLGIDADNRSKVSAVKLAPD